MPRMAAAGTYDHTKALQGQQIAPTLRTHAPDADRVMRRQDQLAFAYTAWWFHVFILVRRSNPESINYIGQPRFIPKGPDTKAKTAQNNVYIEETKWTSKVAGLVVNPHAPGMASAYASPDKLGSALKEWKKFEASGRHCDELYWEDEKTPSRAHLPSGQPFFTDTRPGTERFGALMKDTGRGVLYASYIHGDYDLFAVVPADNPGVNIVVSEQHASSPWSHMNRSGKTPGATSDAEKTPEQKAQEIPNFRGQKFIDVQNMLNARMGVPMVLHGSQEKAVNSFKEEVDVFLPNGMDSFSLLTEADLRRFYDVVLKGRKLHNFMAGDPAEVRRGHFGRWQQVGAESGPGLIHLLPQEIVGANFTQIVN
ncbi:hypothetical protein [Marivita sp. XM-24bin2]|uniref:hypothetical protein n=1 Tax=unclassified Marivita TaxID=2632480 RepID=UPI0025BEEBE9|nr:hypothetical protein [Marivita sp. XM-24bin2]MCR9108711.1 hypothetical protein [Paracoccaceae bacterium]